MDIKIFNKDNLKDNEIDEIVTRVKVFLINNENKILIANSGGCYMLPGGHVEDDESFISTLQREMLEETGIEIESDEIKEPFFEVRTITKNLKNSGINRLSKIIYYLIKSNKKPDLTKTNLTDREKENNFQINFIDANEFENTMQNVINCSPVEVNRIIALETLTAFKQLEKFLKQHAKCN